MKLGKLSQFNLYSGEVQNKTSLLGEPPMTPCHGFRSQWEFRLSFPIDERAMVLDGDDVLTELFHVIDAEVYDEQQAQELSGRATATFRNKYGYPLCPTQAY